MSETKPQAIAIAGPNGAGKTTLAPFLIRDEYGLMEYINADPIALGLAAFGPERVAFEAGRIMLKRLYNLAEQDLSFAFETTLASRSYAGWIRTLRARDYEFHLIYLWLNSADLAVERVREHVRKGGHDVLEEVIRRRYVKGVRNFFDLYMGLADTWGIYDNSSAGGPVQVAIKNKNTATEIHREDLWRRFREAAG
ncbi:MAG: Zeta toxin family protein [Acidobacteria bacterium]|nr:MAG: Zeta toxin family protein [Acidobacteriota bacterium]